MEPSANKARVRAYLGAALDAVRHGDASATDEYLTDDAAFHDPGRPPSIGREAQKQRSAALLGAFPDAEFDIQDLVEEGDRVAVRWVMRGTHRGPFGGVPATNKPVRMSGMTIYRLVDGKIAEAHSDLDQLGLLQQLGAIPGPGG